MATLDPDARPDHLADDVEEELAAALPGTQGSRFFPMLQGLAWHLVAFILLGGGLIYIHLRLMGAQNLKTLRDFLPAWDSHRYKYKTQIVKNDCHWLARWSRARVYWIFNCTFYCPFSVASLEWASYLTKVVEIWWCPFGHAQKQNYAGSAIDASYWHVSKDVAKLHPEDRDNPIWNKDA